MKTKAIIIFLLLSYISFSSYAQQKIQEVTNVGKTGSLIKSGDKKIYMNTPIKGSYSDFEFPQEIKDKLALAQAPFDNIDLILVTPTHVDYISLDIVKQHLQNNPKAIFASTEQMVNALNDFSDRCVAFYTTKERSETKVINDITIKASYTPQESEIVNVCFVVTVNGLTLVQSGHFETEVSKGENISSNSKD